MDELLAVVNVTKGEGGGGQKASKKQKIVR